MAESFFVHQPRRSLSQVNRESRSETNDDYIHLKSRENRGLMNDVFFNPRKDTILFPARNFTACWRGFVRLFSNREDVPVERIALDIGIMYANISPPLFTKKSFLPWIPTQPCLFDDVKFPYLEELRFIMGTTGASATAFESELNQQRQESRRQILSSAREWLASNDALSSKDVQVKTMVLCGRDFVYGVHMSLFAIMNLEEYVKKPGICVNVV
jgi:hypothetical protein